MKDHIDTLIYTAVFSQGEEKIAARKKILERAAQNGIFSASIYPFYTAIGNNKVSSFTVPAINIRALTYDTARVIFRLMNKHSISAVIFEIARSEIQYTDQRPDEYGVSVLAAAMKENYTGPIFLQGDHYQLSKGAYAIDPHAETQRIKDLIQKSIDAQFLNIDIDASTLVDLDKPTLDEQQKNNYEATAELTGFIRELEPKGVTISIGGEIGHIGGKNSTVEDFEAFMKGYLKKTATLKGISKVSVQTGTSHGGIPLPNGKMADVKLDFSVLENIGKVAKEKYHLAGAVQHGASTLPQELFNKFPQTGTAEIHLATGFQNIVYDTIPDGLKEKMYQWIKENCKNEREEGWTEEQFLYKTRKKAIGPFKKHLWELSEAEKKPVADALEKQFEFLFERLNVFNTKDAVRTYAQNP